MRVLTLNLKLQVTEVKLQIECVPLGMLGVCGSAWVVMIKKVLLPLGRTGEDEL